MCDSEDDSDWEVGPCPADLKSYFLSVREVCHSQSQEPGARKRPRVQAQERIRGRVSILAALGACRSRQRPMMAPRRQALQCH